MKTDLILVGKDYDGATWYFDTEDREFVGYYHDRVGEDEDIVGYYDTLKELEEGSCGGLTEAAYAKAEEIAEDYID